MNLQRRFRTRQRPARVLVPAVLVVGLMLALGAHAQAQVLKQVPSDAFFVLKVKNLQDVSGKIAALAQQWGLAGMNPALADPLAAFQQKAGMNQGLAKDGEMAIVIPTLPEEGAEPQVVALVPVTDYNAFVGNFQDAKPAGAEGVSAFTTPKGDPAWVAKWGDYAAISNTEALLASKPEKLGLTAKGPTAKELDAKDMVLFVNMVPLREKLMPKLKEARQQMMKEIDKSFTPQEGKPDVSKYAPAVQALGNQFMNAVEGFVNTADAITYGVNLSNDGINMTFMTNFQEGSYAANVAGQLKGTDDAMLGGLPQAKYIVVAGSAFDPKVVSKVVSDFIAPVEKELAPLGEDVKPITTYLDALKQYVAACNGQRMGMVAPSGQLGQEAIFQVISVTYGDANQLMGAQKQMMSAQESLMQMFSAAAPQGEAPKMSVAVTPDAREVEGVKLSQFKSSMAATDPANPNPEMQKMNQMMTMMYGPDGPSGYFGAVTPKRFMVVSGGGDQLLTSAVQAVKSDENVISKNEQIAAVAQQLPKQRLGAAYLHLDTLISTGATYATQLGLPVQVQLPPDLPPLGFTVSTEGGTAYRYDAHIPSQTVQALIAAGMQAAMQMQGGRQPGGPGGL